MTGPRLVGRRRGELFQQTNSAPCPFVARSRHPPRHLSCKRMDKKSGALVAPAMTRRTTTMMLIAFDTSKTFAWLDERTKPRGRPTRSWAPGGRARPVSQQGRQVVVMYLIRRHQPDDPLLWHGALPDCCRRPNCLEQASATTRASLVPGCRPPSLDI